MLSPGAIAGIAIGSLMLTICLTVSFYLLYRSRTAIHSRAPNRKFTSQGSDIETPYETGFVAVQDSSGSRVMITTDGDCTYANGGPRQSVEHTNQRKAALNEDILCCGSQQASGAFRLRRYSDNSTAHDCAESEGTTNNSLPNFGTMQVKGIRDVREDQASSRMRHLHRFLLG